MLKNSTIQLLRLKFSFFLMPVYWLALSQVDHISVYRAVLIFFILHFLLYPASNGYNSYMDRDTTSIGGLEKPPPPERELFYVSLILDIAGLIASLFIDRYFFICTLLFITASRMYSYRGIRLKKFPVTGYLTAIVFQGAVVYYMTYHGSSAVFTDEIPFVPMTAASLLIGSFYPLTQIYQHDADRADGVKTISILLGYRGTFIFTAITYSTAMALLAFYFFNNLESERFLVILAWMLPVLFYFIWWFLQVRKNTATADFKNTMRMNMIASACTNAAFICLLIMKP